MLNNKNEETSNEIPVDSAPNPPAKNRILSISIVVIVMLIVGLMSYLGVWWYVENKDQQEETPVLGEEDILNVPADDAPPEVSQAYLVLLAQNARKADVLDITDCEPNPLVLDMDESSNITVKNEGATNRLIRLGNSGPRIVRANSSIDVFVDFSEFEEQGPGILTYACDNINPAGIVLNIIE